MSSCAWCVCREGNRASPPAAWRTPAHPLVECARSRSPSSPMHRCRHAIGADERVSCDANLLPQPERSFLLLLVPRFFPLKVNTVQNAELMRYPRLRAKVWLCDRLCFVLLPTSQPFSLPVLRLLPLVLVV